MDTHETSRVRSVAAELLAELIPVLPRRPTRATGKSADPARLEILVDQPAVKHQFVLNGLPDIGCSSKVSRIDLNLRRVPITVRHCGAFP
jgi:hypothetical protein